MQIILLACLVLAADDAKTEVRARASAATVKVVSADDKAEGSGVLLRRHGRHVYILTAAHVVARARTVEVEVGGTKVRKYAGVAVLARSADADLALLRFTTDDELPAALPLAPPPKKDAAVPGGTVSVGWSNGQKLTVVEETVRSKKQVRRPDDKASTWTWETAGKPVPGRSGGPLVDAEGCVLGIASGHDRDRGYYVHGDEVRAFLKREGFRWLTEMQEQ